MPQSCLPGRKYRSILVVPVDKCGCEIYNYNAQFAGVGRSIVTDITTTIQTSTQFAKFAGVVKLGVLPGVGKVADGVDFGEGLANGLHLRF